MTNKTVASGLVGLLALGGVATIATPIASAQTAEEPSSEVQERIDSHNERLDALVAAGTITQAQADEITSRFSERAERRSERRDDFQSAMSELLGISADDLMAAFQDGQSLAEIAAANGVDVQSVINTLVIEANAHLDEKLADGSIDQARADEIRAGLVDRVTARVNGERPGPGERGGRFGGERPGPGERGGSFGGEHMGRFGRAGFEGTAAGFAPRSTAVGQA